ncbi:MAG: guanine deaminase [Firmicutes bacterium]|nr:guanine deaminase [Bacillota bacterium]
MDAGEGRGLKGYRGTLLHFLDDPFVVGEEEACAHVADGLLVVDGQGRVVSAGPWSQGAAEGLEVVDWRGCLLVPGFVDTHIHYPQTAILAAYSGQVLEWLEQSAFPEEERFAEEAYARRVADVFLKELFRNGTTTASVFCTVHPPSVNAFFEAAEAVQARMVAGKVMMDRNGPVGLLDTPQRAYDESKALIERWHDRGRARYSLTPRFAPTSTEAQLEMIGALRVEFPQVHLQTHISENPAEIAWVKSLFGHLKPNLDYLDVYDHYGLLGPGTILAHGVHLEERDLQRMAESHTALAFCPMSNLFLGSGLLPVWDVLRSQRPVRLSLATDVGGGNRFSMLQALNEGYKVAHLRGRGFTPLQGFYLATLGGARALGLDDRIGSFQPGREADFVVLDPKATPIQAFRLERHDSLQDRLFTLMMLGDDRSVRATYVLGQRVHGQA